MHDDELQKDYEVLWALTNLTAILKTAEIEAIFTKDLRDTSPSTFVIQKLVGIICDGALGSRDRPE